MNINIEKPRNRILQMAHKLINGERHNTYGEAKDNWSTISAHWTEILGHEVDASQCCLCMASVKMARLRHSPDHLDSFADAIGYMALAYELMLEERDA